MNYKLIAGFFIINVITSINGFYISEKYKAELTKGKANEAGFIFLNIQRDKTPVLNIIFGNNVVIKDEVKTCGDDCYESNSFKLQIKSRTNEVDAWDIEWTTPNKDDTIMDCIDLGENQWFGGPQQKKQYWPIQKLQLTDFSMITKEDGNCAVNEPYWLSDSGAYIYVDPKTPLFVDQRSREENKVCFIAKITDPYSAQDKLVFKYTVVIKDNPRKAHEDAIVKFLNKPTGIPDELMIKYPIWSTWARYKVNVDEKTVTDFATEIKSRNFTNSQIEIDDDWETCYGALDFNTEKFSDMKTLVTNLKSKGFRVTLWIHPFVNKDCEAMYKVGVEKKYFVEDESGSVETKWWNSKRQGAGLIDFTKEEAKNWWLDRINNLRTSYGIDGFKCDAGESSWAPQIPKLTGDVELQPNLFTTEYVKTCASLGSMTEVRSGYRTQNLPIFVRMVDKDSRWGFYNGLSTVITTTLQMNLNGYPFVLPDMVGGNAYWGDTVTKELFIRWLQVNVFLPSIQYSLVPWDFDNETVELSRQFTDLHSQYADKIIELAKKTVKDGSPINPPIWWIAPNDAEALKINDEFLLGETILVAPIVQKSATARDIYLPAGLWYDENNNKNLSGARWIKNYSAPLNILPYFTRIGDQPNSGINVSNNLLFTVFVMIVSYILGQ